MQVVQNGLYFSVYCSKRKYLSELNFWDPDLYRSVTAIADKLGLEFALFHRKRDGKTEDAPEKMELLVGDVKDKVSSLSPTITRHSRPAIVKRVLCRWQSW